MPDNSSKPRGLINRPVTVEDLAVDVSDPDEEKIMTLPAVYVDTFATTYWGNVIRLALGEEGIDDREYWRYAVLLRLGDAKRLIKRLQRAVDHLEKPEEE